jgi:hypothetical protein
MSHYINLFRQDKNITNKNGENERPIRFWIESDAPVQNLPMKAFRDLISPFNNVYLEEPRPNTSTLSIFHRLVSVDCIITSKSAFSFAAVWLSNTTCRHLVGNSIREDGRWAWINQTSEMFHIIPE